MLFYGKFYSINLKKIGFRMKNKLDKFLVLIVLFFGVNFVFCSEAIDEEREFLIEEFSKKMHDASYELTGTAKKSFEAAKKIIVFPKGVDEERIILTHPEDIHFLTSNPHFIHKHVLVCTFSHNNDIRLVYDKLKDDFFFHTKDSVRKKRLLAEKDQDLVYELDYFALRHKRKDPEADPSHPNFIILGRPTSLHPSFKRKGDGCYYVEIASGSRENKPTQSGNHNWLRLIDAEGNVISIGMHPKITVSPMVSYAKIPVRFFNSDVYEWVNNRTFYAHTFPLSQAEYLSLKEEILKDMIAASKNEFSFDYSIFEGNCCDWMVQKLAKYLQIDTSGVVTDLYVTVFPNLYDYYRKSTSDEMKMVLSPFIKLITYGAHIPRLIRAAVSGGFSVNEENPQSKPFIKYSWDFLLNVDMHVALHPYLFEEYLGQHEKELLEKRKAALAASKENENKIKK
jgi:hypothetical protein